VAHVALTSHLFTYFPDLARGSIVVDAATVAEVVAALEQRAPGFAYYVCDELGRLRRHVNVFVENEMIHDRRSLSDRVGADSRVFIAQALSGG
jgi:molybdopterin synthase sulfur carrier subunit